MKKLMTILFLFLWICKVCYSEIDVERTLNSLSSQESISSKIISKGNIFYIFYQV